MIFVPYVYDLICVRERPVDFQGGGLVFFQHISELNNLFSE